MMDTSSAQATVKLLGNVAAAFIGSDDYICPLMESALTAEQLAQLQEQRNAGIGSHAYASLAVGYRQEGDQPVGLIVFHYADADDAEADLDLRRTLSQEGRMSQYGMRRYSVVFTVDEATVQGSDLVLRVGPSDGTLRVLHDIVETADMLFAYCP
jgi:hypothetical protein